MITLVGTVLLQMLGFLIGVRARDDRQHRIECFRLRDHLAAFERIRNGDEKAPGAWNIGGLKDVGIRGVAVNHLDAGLTRLQRSGPDFLDQDKRNLLVLEVAGDDAPDASVADQHDVVGGVGSGQRLAACGFGGRVDAAIGGRRLERWRLVLGKIPVESGKQHGIEQD